jgi:hypothetical protein
MVTYLDFFTSEPVVLFNPPWYRIDRWLWWLFICGNSFSRFDWAWVSVGCDGHPKFVRAVKEK